MWFIIGLIIGASLLTLVLWVRSRKIAVKRYDWLVGASGLGLLLFAIQNFTASFAEHEGVAAWNFLWMFGAPALILLAVFFLLLWYRRSSAANPSSFKQTEPVTNK